MKKLMLVLAVLLGGFWFTAVAYKAVRPCAFATSVAASSSTESALRNATLLLIAEGIVAGLLWSRRLYGAVFGLMLLILFVLYSDPNQVVDDCGCHPLTLLPQVDRSVLTLVLLLLHTALAWGCLAVGGKRVQSSVTRKKDGGLPCN